MFDYYSSYRVTYLSREIGSIKGFYNSSRSGCFWYTGGYGCCLVDIIVCDAAVLG
jgi:hypothetical protein